jgi:phosphoribosylanthranilate isomerase
MSLILPVLVRGINNLSDARYCAGMGADGLIFTLDPGLPGAVDAATVKELAGWVAGVDIIGEFGNVPGPEVNRLVEECGLSSVLLRLDPSRRSLPEGLAVPALLEVPAALITDQHYYTAAIADLTTALPQGFAFFTTLPATADAAEHAYWQSLARQSALWLAGPPAPTQARQLAEAVQPTGLILAGGDEIKPGLRDFTELEAVFEALEEA